LASAVRDSHHTASAAPLTAHWTREFSVAPRWQALAKQLNASTEREADFNLALAEIACSVAGEAGWAPADLAYWRALDARAIDDDAPLAALLPIDRCAAVAQRLIDGDDLPLDLEFPRIDWSALRVQARNLGFLPSHHLGELEATRLKVLAQAAHWRDEAMRREKAAAIHASADGREAVAALGELLRTLAGGPCSAWLATRPDQSQEGDGISADANGATSTFVDLSMDAFQNRRLSAAFRSSRDLADEKIGWMGRIYGADETTLERLSPYLPLLVDAVASIHRRDRNTTTSAEAAAVELHFEQRLREAVAEFSAGAGHEINNPLAAISGQVQRLLVDEVEPDRRRSLTKIYEQLDLVHRMIRDLHLIGRKNLPRREPATVSEILVEAASLAGKRRPVANVTIAPTPDEAQLMGAPRDLARLISELILNGVEAAGPDGQVEVVVELLADPAWLAVRVRDSGPGFSEESRRLCSIPYYSGRPAGRGLGMGLPVAHRLTEDHGGRLEISRGRPTMVSVYLPRHIEETGPYALPAA
jgi:signal transduction histidine kinase